MKLYDKVKIKNDKSGKIYYIDNITYDRENTAIVNNLINIDDDNDTIDESFYFSELELAED